MHQNDLDEFSTGNCRSFTMLFGVRCFEDEYQNEECSGIIDELRLLHGNEISTDEISKSIKLIINKAKL